ncbi:MAG: right-handed parallel beta-helix repeat-containing protein [Armatimonadetes bacterium]|nr:right-handed parallel beta-helix repeat-containing protein [Armatimonadota bacterium]
MPFLAALVSPAPQTALKTGTVISRTTVVAPRVYRLPNADESWSKAAITVKGKGITVDFRGATLQGADPSVEPDARKGLGVLVTGENVTIKNLRIRGYKVGLFAKGCQGLRLIDCDFSYNWKQHLLSDTEKEDTADWMSFHKNENREWFRYGAGAYLEDCDKFEVKNLRVTGGQCGLMLTRCDFGKVWNCDLSFNSGLGLGMYRSSDNKVMHNKMDWCVRGYSHGVYNRGQDSAGILVFEQCMRNVFAYNSATHGGDGFFLWAGQHTMDTGEGGCNDNLLYGNDFSHSPANAIEATFSRNAFVMNRLIDCWHGIWGGYSYDTKIIANVFALNGEAVAIEHGQKNTLWLNSFDGDTLGVYLWQNAGKPDPNWGYPKHKDTRNFGSVVLQNNFNGLTEAAVVLGSGTDVKVQKNTVNQSKKAFVFSGEQNGTIVGSNSVFGDDTEPTYVGVAFRDNVFSKNDTTVKAPWMTRGGNANVSSEPEGLKAYLASFGVWFGMRDLEHAIEEAQEEGLKEGLEDLKAVAKYHVEPLDDGQDPFIPQGSIRGRRYILVDEWGPYDFRRPLLWPRGKVAASSTAIEPDGRQTSSATEGRTFEILGPTGTWKLKSATPGVTLTARSGSVPGKVTAQWPATSQDIDIELAYVGGATVDHRGVFTPKGRPVTFGWSKSFLPIAWTVRFWTWAQGSDPRTEPEAFAKTLEGGPVATYADTELSFATGGSPRQGVPADRFATKAEGTFETGAGPFTLNVTADDGVRVWVDGKQVIDEWHWQAPTQYTRDLNLAKGRHTIRVDHFEIDGYTALKVEVKPKKRV